MVLMGYNYFLDGFNSFWELYWILIGKLLLFKLRWLVLRIVVVWIVFLVVGRILLKFLGFVFFWLMLLIVFINFLKFW